jgi:hypothetical protein
MQQQKLFVVAGNPLGFGGGIRQHRAVTFNTQPNAKDLLEIPVLNNEAPVIGNDGNPRTAYIYNGNATTSDGRSIKGALVYRQGGKWHALQAGLENKGGPQEEGFYQHLLTKYPLPRYQEFWNRKLADFVIDRYSKFDAQQTRKNNVLAALCDIQTGDECDDKCKQIIPIAL